MAEATMFFPADFRWGTATAAEQVEGYNTNSDWWRWEQENGRILEGHRQGAACNWWENAEADLDRAAEMGTNAHRLSLAWSRIEPEPSVFSQEALDRYREILMAMIERGIEPMVTLHHFSNPLWLVEKGDFHADVVVDYFRRYTAKVVESLGDLIPLWITINEPMVYVFLRYLEGVFPAPREAGFTAGMRALAAMLRCHAAAYHIIKAAYPAAQVGIAKNVPIIEARSGGPLGRWWAGQLHWLFNDLTLEALRTGRLRWPAGRGAVTGLAGSYDFVGLNYYTRFYAKFPPFGGLLESDWGPGAVVSDGNYGEVYPAGMFRAIKYALRFGKPVYITENGVPDADDDLRPGFILTHLREIWRAISFSYPVMGYYHWSLVDNFEWDRGWTQRFGLIEIDPATQARRMRPSGELYGEICRLGGINSDMTRRHAPALMPVLFPG
jgi:beta-glucosidase